MSGRISPEESKPAVVVEMIEAASLLSVSDGNEGLTSPAAAAVEEPWTAFSELTDCGRPLNEDLSEAV